MKQSILFLRNARLFGSEELAIEGLNGLTHKKGQPVVAIYGESEAAAKLIFAIGKKDGTGEDAYEILSTGSDVSDLVTLVEELTSTVTKHVSSLAGTTPGHAKSGGDITFNNGIGTVNAGAITYSKLQKIVGEKKVLGSISAGGGVTELGSEELLQILGEISAAKLATARNITLSGGVTGTVSTDFSSDVTITTTVTDNSHKHTIDNITNLQDELDKKANLESPSFTGKPLAPTAGAGDSSTQIATTAFVSKEIQDKLAAANAMTYKGTLGTGGTAETLPTSHKIGDTYVAIKGAPAVNGIALEPGDMVICVKAGTLAKDTDWTVVQTNIDGAVTGPVSAIAENLAVFDGATGKVIKDGGIAVANIVQTSRKVSAGTGLTGGGALTGDVTISHGAKPSSGTDAGGEGTFVTGVTIDKNGHVASTTKSSLTGGASAQSGKYVSAVEISGTNITVTQVDLPAESGKVKVDAEDTSGYLIDKIKTGSASGNSYAVTVTDSGNNLSLTCTIDTIDGGTY